MTTRHTTQRAKTRGQRAKPRPFWPYLILALAVHGLGGLGAVHYRLAEPIPPLDVAMEAGATGEATPIDLELIEPVVLNPLAERPTEEQAQAELADKAAEAAKAEESLDTPGQVVDLARPSVEIRPDDARYLAEYDSKVQKETRARGAPGRPGDGKEDQEEAPPPQPSQAAQTPPPPAPEAPAKSGALAMREPGSGAKPEPTEPAGEIDGREGPATDDGAGARAGAGPEVPEADKPGGGAGSPQTGDGKPLPTLAELRPTDDTLRGVMGGGGGGSLDALGDVDDGEETLLNTKRFRYASFFNRVKHAVAQSWHPDDAYRLRDPSGRIYGIKARRTMVRVSLRPDGSLAGAQVERASGVEFLDDEAVRALQGAQPFPNPPQGLVDKSSRLITFRFEFNFEVVEAPSFRVFRQ